MKALAARPGERMGKPFGHTALMIGALSGVELSFVCWADAAGVDGFHERFGSQESGFAFRGCWYSTYPSDGTPGFADSFGESRCHHPFCHAELTSQVTTMRDYKAPLAFCRTSNLVS